MNILGIETSCDETAAAVVTGGRNVRSSVVFSQAAHHGPYGGVVPELASRMHVEHIPWVIEKAVGESDLAWGDIDAVAATYGPGLASSLMIGLTSAKALALRLDRPLVGVNHLQAHIYSAFLDEDGPRFDGACPFVALVVSGGHTSLVRVDDLGTYTVLGQTLDDAAGEAFDKGASLLKLGYPGGPAIDKCSRGLPVNHVAFPRGRQRRDRSAVQGLDAELCFSFSGLKTALLYYLRDHPVGDGAEERALVAAAYQEAIVDALVERCGRVVGRGERLAVVGGVSLNSRLRARMKELAADKGVELLLAKPSYCGDNAAMVAGLAGAGGGITGADALSADVQPSLGLRDVRAEGGLRPTGAGCAVQ